MARCLIPSGRRSTPSPRREEGWGEGVRISNVGNFVPPSPGRFAADLSSPGRGVGVCRSALARCARTAGMKASLSLDRLRVDRRAGAAGDHQRRAAEEELVDLVARAILREL